VSKNNGHWPTHARKAKGRDQRKKLGPPAVVQAGNNTNGRRKTKWGE